VTPTQVGQRVRVIDASGSPLAQLCQEAVVTFIDRSTDWPLLSVRTDSGATYNMYAHRFEVIEAEVVPLPELVKGRQYVVTDATRLIDGEPQSYSSSLELGEVVTLLDPRPDIDGELLVETEGGEEEFVAPEGLTPLPVEEAAAESTAVEAELVTNVFLAAEKPELPPVEELPLEYALDVVAYIARRANNPFAA
jgi:hypothetical protein